MKARSQRGSTLIITVLLLAATTAVAVALLTSVRIERSAVHAHFERQRAVRLAGFGIEQTLAVLRRETGTRMQVRDTENHTWSCFPNYATQPGVLFLPSIPSAGVIPAEQAFTLTRKVQLSSGKATVLSPTDQVLAPPNLNMQMYVSDTSAHLLSDRQDITGTTTVMPVKWIYLRQNRQNKPGDPSTWTEEEDASELPTIDDARPIIGRYAYWVDDESSKINYNTAWKRDPGPGPSVHSNPSRAAHPSLVNLMGLALPDGTQATEAIADSLFRWRDRSPNRPFNSFADARQADPGLLKVLDYNKFELTHYNHDPDVSVFGEDRILLTTRRNLVPKVNGTPTRRFLDILRDDIDATVLDPGLRDDIAGGQQDWRGGADGSVTLPNKFDSTVRMIMRYLRARHWPMSPGTSFQDKYFPGTPETDPRLAQLAVNIIEYVRAKESRQVAVPPLHYGLDASGRYSLHHSVALGPQSFQGLNRGPLITEMAMTVAAQPVTMPAGASTTPSGWPVMEGTGQPRPLYPCLIKVELHIPANYQVVDSAGLSGINLVPVKTTPFPAGAQRCWFIALHETYATSRTYYVTSPTTQAMVALSSHATHAMPLLNGEVVGKNGTTLRPGGYATITKTVYREQPHNGAPEAALLCTLYQGTSGPDGLLAGDTARWPCFNQAPHREPVPYSIAPPNSTTDATVPSLEVDDPRINVSVTDWRLATNGTNTFGLVNSLSTLGTKLPDTLGIPQQDTDATGALTPYGGIMPPAFGVGTNTDAGDNGLVTTVGELGHVCTGLDAGGTGTPWRTLRLQPNRLPTTTTVPDWALLDLFTVLHISSVKVKEPTAIYLPHGTSVGGRVNVNSRVDAFPQMERNGALRAALTGARSLKSKTDAATIASNIYHHVLAEGDNPGKRYGGGNRPEMGLLYGTPGEICEIKGLSDTGESSEDLAREVMSLFTSKGGVFSIYTVGQALVQTRSGQLVVTGEHRQQTMVERIVESSATASPAVPQVRFRTVYTRNLEP